MSLKEAYKNELIQCRELRRAWRARKRGAYHRAYARHCVRMIRQWREVSRGLGL